MISCKSFQLQYMLKHAFKKVQDYSVAQKYGLENDTEVERITWSNIWKIKNPRLRSVRLKILYKDVFSNERRARLGITNTNKCIVCGEVETVVHQLLICNNAKRMWKIWMNLFNVAAIEPYDLLNCGPNILSEIVKAVILKQLIQIDRSKDCHISSIVNRIKHFLRIEHLARKDAETESLIFKLADLH